MQPSPSLREQICRELGQAGGEVSFSDTIRILGRKVQENKGLPIFSGLTREDKLLYIPEQIAIALFSAPASSGPNACSRVYDFFDGTGTSDAPSRVSLREVLEMPGVLQSYLHRQVKEYVDQPIPLSPRDSIDLDGIRLLIAPAPQGITIPPIDIAEFRSVLAAGPLSKAVQALVNLRIISADQPAAIPAWRQEEALFDFQNAATNTAVSLHQLLPGPARRGSNPARMLIFCNVGHALVQFRLGIYDYQHRDASMPRIFYGDAWGAAILLPFADAVDRLQTSWFGQSAPHSSVLDQAAALLNLYPNIVADWSKFGRIKERMAFLQTSAMRPQPATQLPYQRAESSGGTGSTSPLDALLAGASRAHAVYEQRSRQFDPQAIGGTPEAQLQSALGHGTATLRAPPGPPPYRPAGSLFFTEATAAQPPSIFSPPPPPPQAAQDFDMTLPPLQ